MSSETTMNPITQETKRGNACETSPRRHQTAQPQRRRGPVGGQGEGAGSHAPVRAALPGSTPGCLWQRPRPPNALRSTAPAAPALGLGHPPEPGLAQAAEQRSRPNLGGISAPSSLGEAPCHSRTEAYVPVSCSPSVERFQRQDVAPSGQRERRVGWERAPRPVTPPPHASIPYGTHCRFLDSETDPYDSGPRSREMFNQDVAPSLPHHTSRLLGMKERGTVLSQTNKDGQRGTAPAMPGCFLKHQRRQWCHPKGLSSWTRALGRESSVF